jgi:hypothetical protein
VNNLRQQIDTNQMMSGKYPTPEEVLRLVSPIVRAHKPASTFATNRDQSRDAPNRGGHRDNNRPSSLSCLNCGSAAHLSGKCDKRCPHGGGFAFCGWAAGKGCHCVIANLPERIPNIKNEPIPDRLYTKVQDWRKANPTKIQSPSSTSRATTALHTSSTVDDCYSPFGQDPTRTGDAVIMTMHVPTECPFQQWRSPSHVPSMTAPMRTPQPPPAMYCEPADDEHTPAPSMHARTEAPQKGGREHASTTPGQNRRVTFETPPTTMAHMRVMHDPQTSPSVEFVLDATKLKTDDATTINMKYQHHIDTPIRSHTNGAAPSSPSLTSTRIPKAHDTKRGKAPAPPAKCYNPQSVSSRMRANADAHVAMRTPPAANAPPPINAYGHRARDPKHVTNVSKTPFTHCPKNGDAYGMRRPAGKSTWGKSDKASRERARRANINRKKAAAKRQLRVEQERMDEFEMQAMIEPECAVCQTRLVTELLVNCGQDQEPGHRGHGACEVCAPLIVAHSACHLCRGPVHRYITMDASFF